MSSMFELLEPRRLLAVSMLADLNTTTAGSWARPPVVIDSVGYMFARDGVHGTELWRTDGTAAGTWMVTDINPGPGGSGGFSLHEAGGLLYFPATDVTGLVDLWRSDGTPQGTLKLTHVGEPNRQFLIGDVIDLNGTAIFGVNGRGIWRSDGSVEGTQQITSNGVNTRIARLGDYIYFFHRPTSGGAGGLWRTDGTSAGTALVRPFQGINHSWVIEANGRLYFWASDSPSETGTEPWSSDGTAEGTVPLGDLAPGSNSSEHVYFAEFNGAVYFAATTMPHDSRLTLFRTDGTAGSASPIANIGSNSYVYEQPGIVVYNNAMYFRGNKPGSGSELWRSDGTPEGTGQFIDLNPGSASSFPSAFAVYNDRLYFKAQTAATGVEMFSTDGTVEGTTLLKNIAPGSRGIDSSYTPSPVIFNGRLWFRADDILHGMELWSTDGTEQGTVMLKDINTATNDANPSEFAPGPGGLAYFTANDGVEGVGLYRTNGTPAGTSRVASLGQLAAGGLTYANGLLHFAAADQFAWWLWRSDGTEAGTYRLKSIASPFYAGSSGDGLLVKVGERVFFPSAVNSNAYDLWVSDGTHAGTQLVRAAGPSFNAVTFSGIEYEGKFLFSSLSTLPSVPETGGLTGAIFISDGTDVGTMLVKGGFIASTATSWTLFDGKAFFAARTAAAGTELWMTDGTPMGTVLVADIHPGAGHSSPDNLVVTADALYFAATDPVNGRELWRLRRGETQPQRVTSLVADVQQVQRAAGSGVIVTASSALFRFDGANLIRLDPATFNRAANLLGADNRFNYFAAGTDAFGIELWRTDGTAAGTVMVIDLVPGSGSSVPQGFGFFNRDVFFSAKVPLVGRELFVLSQYSHPVDGPFDIEPASAVADLRMIDLVDDDAGNEPLIDTLLDPRSMVGGVI